MKKIIRILSLIALLGLFLCLCGCSYLDELRASRATITESGAICLSDGTEYLLLPESQYLSPDFSDTTTIYVLEDEEVPLLLTKLFGHWGYKSQDGQFLEAYSTGKSRYYCRADAYDSILTRINSDFVPDVWAYSYYDHDSREYKLYTLTVQQIEAIEYVLDHQRSYKLPSAVSMNYQYQIDLEYYSQDFLFSKDAPDIYYNEGQYYLLFEGALIYEVPQELYSTFETIMAAKIEAVGNY